MMADSWPSWLQDEAQRRMLFPVTGRQIFLAHAGVAPLPGPVAEAIRQEASEASMGDQEGGDFLRKIKNARTVAARLIGGEADEVALLGPTSLGLNLVANGLNWQPGDEVVFFQDDYPANVYPWQHLESRGVKLVRLKPETDGRITPDLVFAALSSRTRLVALASCHFLTGWRLDYQTIGAELQKRGVLFCLDAIQSLGATPIDVRHVDFLSADSHKWLLGPLGAGIFYVKKSRFETLLPSLFGSWNVESPNFVAQTKIDYYEGARRYEPGALYLIGIVGMVRAMELLLEYGVEKIERRLLHLHGFATIGLERLGFEVRNASGAPGEKSGIVSAIRPGTDLQPAYERLRAAKVTVSLRSGRDGQAHLRFSPHFYNTEAEISQALEILK
jgi:selenocysteine lyase/cysteine desulfurase